MKTNIPTVILDGTPFRLDYENKLFVQLTFPENRIDFSRLEKHGEYYLLNYDAANKRNVSSSRHISNDVKVISIHHAIVDNPEHILDQAGFCKIHNLKSYEQDRNILLIDDHIGARLNGKLPIVEICDHPFYVDLFMRSLRPHDDYSTQLRIPEMYPYNKEELQFFYLPNSHKLVPLHPDHYIAPAEVVIVILPSEKALDPISYARMCGMEETALLPKYPAVPVRIAEIKTSRLESKKTMVNKKRKGKGL